MESKELPVAREGSLHAMEPTAVGHFSFCTSVTEGGLQLV